MYFKHNKRHLTNSTSKLHQTANQFPQMENIIFGITMEGTLLL